MPYIAHKRLVTVIHTPVRTVYHHGTLVPIRIHARVRPSVLAAELNRIRYLPRPSSESYIEKYLNSKDSIYFDDEAREIRARVDSLLRRVHIFVPRAIPSDFSEEIVPERMGNDSYIRRLISGRSNAKKEPEVTSWYDVPERGNFGNLACVKFVAGKPQSVRRPYYKLADLRPSDIKNDVNFLSYYKKNLQAAENAFSEQPMSEREMRKARALEREWNETARREEPEVIRQVQQEEAAAPEIVTREEEVPSTQTVESPEQIIEQLPEEAEIVSEKKEKKKEKKQKEKDVKHEKEEALKRAEAFLIKQTAAARAAEERQRAIDEERAKLELEEQKAWLAMKETQEARAKIAERHEIERLEDLRKAEEQKEEQDRLESLRVAEADKEAAAAAAAVAAEEQLLQAAEEAIEEARRREETEERLAEIATVGGIDDSKECDRSVEEPLTIEETYQEREERPCEIITDDDETHIEEENVTYDREPEEIAFIEEVDENHEAGDNQPEVSPVTGENAVTEEEEATVAAGEESAPSGGEQAMWEAVVAEDNREPEESQEEAIPDKKEEEEHETFDGADEEAEIVDESNFLQDTATVKLGGEESASAEAVQDDLEEESGSVAEEVVETSPVIEEIISPSDGIEETFEWGDEDA